MSEKNSEFKTPNSPLKEGLSAHDNGEKAGFHLSEDGEWIPDGWLVYTLDQVYTFKSGLSKAAKEFGYGYPFLTFKDVFYNYFVPNVLTELANTTEREQENCSVSRGDVFLTRTSETLEELGMSCVSLKHYPKATFNGFCKRLSPLRDEKEIFPEFAGYYFRGWRFRSSVTALSSPSTRASLNNEMLASLSILTPPLPEQKAIADVLSSLDDKIELLREQNETLEALAQTLFKRWFIDFNFPDQNGNPYKDNGGAMIPSELGEIPEGWRAEGLTNFLDIMGGGTPKTSVPEYWNGEYFFYTPKDAKGGFYCGTTEKTVTQAGIDNSSTKLFPEDTIFITARGTVGKTSLALVSMTMNQSCYALKEKNGSNLTGFLLLREAIHKLQKYATGGVFDAITTATLESTLMAYPDQELVEEFEAIMTLKFRKIKFNTQQIQTLTHLRDTLLPKLMKGEIRIKTSS